MKLERWVRKQGGSPETLLEKIRKTPQSVAQVDGPGLGKHFIWQEIALGLILVEAGHRQTG
jgi:hypothetical protein